jgi:AraC family transcriptional regulator of adaptative response/methylated-DNA-[protein]-cysteine methyltransferase
MSMSMAPLSITPSSPEPVAAAGLIVPGCDRAVPCEPPPPDDYAVVRAAIAYLSTHWRDQPDLKSIASAVGVSSLKIERTFRRWAGLSPKQFLQALTLDNARRMLKADASVLDTTYELGLSGPARLHDLFVTHEAMTPGAFRVGGEGLVIRWGWHASPFGRSLVMITDRGLCGIAFTDTAEGDRRAFADMASRWPRAAYVEDFAATLPYATRIFERDRWRPDTPLRIVLIGSDFEVCVWETLLKVPFAAATTYSDVAAHIGRPTAARAVGGAVGRNPLSFVVPCHRVLGKSGDLTGYHWGLTRKRAILGWEAGIAGIAEEEPAAPRR